MIEIPTLVAMFAAVLMVAVYKITYQHKAKRTVCPRWLGVPTKRCYKAKYGYDPALPDNWRPHSRTTGRQYV